MYNRRNHQSKAEWMAKKQALNEQERENRERVRAGLDADVAAFLARGGKIIVAPTRREEG